MARAHAAATRASEGSMATKAAIRAVTVQPVAVIFCNMGTPLLAPTTRSPSVMKSTAPDTATTEPLDSANAFAASRASTDSCELSAPCNLIRNWFQWKQDGKYTDNGMYVANLHKTE
jgi:hypothetical protein